MVTTTVRLDSIAPAVVVVVLVSIVSHAVTVGVSGLVGIQRKVVIDVVNTVVVVVGVLVVRNPVTVEIVAF